jgi:hypothetical protein
LEKGHLGDSARRKDAYGEKGLGEWKLWRRRRLGENMLVEEKGKEKGHLEDGARRKGALGGKGLGEWMLWRRRGLYEKGYLERKRV